MKKLVYIFIALFPFGVFAQVLPGTGACLNTLDLSDPSTYNAPSCGSVNATQWTVSNDSCTMSSPDIIITLGLDSVDITICVTINPTGNMEADDTAELKYTVDGVETTWRTVAGNEFSAVTELCFETKVKVGATMSVAVTYENDHNSEKWRLKDGGMGLCYTVPVSLPIELSKFTAALNIPNVDVDWTTTSESNNNYFIVERSTDGVNFEEFDKVNGAGNSTTAIDYAVVDYNPYVGISYYRLTQYDYDGKTTSSNVVSINNNEGSSVEVSVKVFPNPISRNSDITVELEGFKNKEVLCSLIDAYGIEIYSFVVLSEFNDTYVINSSALPLTSGVYFVRGSTDETLFSRKLVVQ